jgi:RNA polymerase sigma factor (sigma-70 family)
VPHSAASSLNAPLVVSPTVPIAPSPPLHVLTTALARGDDVAWAQFHREYGPALFRQLLAATHGDHDLASEALQRAYLRLARHVRPCDSEPMFRGWLRLIARSALHDCWRRRRSFWQLLNRHAAEPPPGPNDAGALAEEERLQSALDAALAGLEPDDRALLEAKYFAGQNVRTIAEELGVSPKAVESRLTRARAELRRHLISLRDEQA